MPEISPARRAAFRILLAVDRNQSHADDLLRGEAISALLPADRNLTTALVLGVLRWQLRLDELIKAFLNKPGAKLDPEVLIALRLGAFQLFCLNRIPAHAAIGESVELVKQTGHRFASGMVNAVLRKLAGAPCAEFSEQSSAQSHPAWMVERWIAHYGEDAARAVCRHGQSQPALSLRVEGPDAEAELIHAGIELASGELLMAARTVLSGDVTATAAFREERVRIQDEGSQLIAEIAACSIENLNQKVKGILDACAAPGGKTLVLAGRHPQARIVACEASPQRLARMRDRLAGYAGQIECRLADVSAFDAEDVFDLALADVPCSGTGTLGRNPEIRHRLRPEDLALHAERQKAILHGALRAVRPGGRVIYSTCSLEPEENEHVVAEVLSRSSRIRGISLEHAIELLRKKGFLTQNGAQQLRARLTPEGFLRLLPGSLHTDGFFIALIEKPAQ